MTPPGIGINSDDPTKYTVPREILPGLVTGSSAATLVSPSSVCGLKQREALQVGLSFAAPIHIARERIIKQSRKRKTEDD